MTKGRQTVTPEGLVVNFSTMRGHPHRCSEHCSGVFKFNSDLYCRHFNEAADFRCEACVQNEIIKKEGVNMELPNSTLTNRKNKVVYATEAQKDYINSMLDKLCQSLSDFTDTDIDSLSIEEASEVIDDLKDAVDFERMG